MSFVGSQLCFTDGCVAGEAPPEGAVCGLALDHGEVLLLAAALPPPPAKPSPLQRQQNLRGVGHIALAKIMIFAILIRRRS